MAAQAEREVRPLAFWQRRKLREQYVADRLSGEIAAAKDRWAKQAADFDDSETEKKRAQDEEYLRLFHERRARLETQIEGGADFVESQIERYFENEDLGIDFSIEYEYRSDAGTVNLDLALPDIDALPSEKAQVLASGKLSVKPMTAREKQEDYARCTVGLAFYLAGHLFNVSPAISLVCVSGYAERIDRATGNARDEYVFSVAFDRPAFEALNVQDIDPLQAISGFRARLKLSKTFQMAAIEPL